MASATQLQLCTLTRKIQPREAKSATSTLSLHSPFLVQSFAFLYEDLPISDTKQLILFLESSTNRIYSRNPSSDQTNLTNTYLT